MINEALKSKRAKQVTKFLSSVAGVAKKTVKGYREYFSEDRV